MVQNLQSSILEMRSQHQSQLQSRDEEIIQLKEKLANFESSNAIIHPLSDSSNIDPKDGIIKKLQEENQKLRQAYQGSVKKLKDLKEKLKKEGWVKLNQSHDKRAKENKENNARSNNTNSNIFGSFSSEWTTPGFSSPSQVSRQQIESSGFFQGFKTGENMLYQAVKNVTSNNNHYH